MLYLSPVRRVRSSLKIAEIAKRGAKREKKMVVLS